MSLDGIFAHILAKELNNQLKDTRVEKVFQPEKDEIILILRGGGKNLRLLLCCDANNARVNITQSTKENPMAAPMFCMLLRKHLSGARLIGVIQNGVERAIEFEFETYTELGDKDVKYLVIEIMGRFSNIIFVDSQRLVIDSIKHVDITTSSQRQILPRLKYEFPPAQDKINPLEITKSQLDSLVLSENANKKTDKFLLEKFLGLSPIICREISHRAGVFDQNIADLSGSQRERFCFHILSHFENVKNNINIYPVILNDPKTNAPLYFSYTPINQYGYKVVEQRLETFSYLLDMYYFKRDEVERLRQRGAQILKTLVNHTERLSKKQNLLFSELKSAKDREQLKLYGDLITANIYKIQQGDEVLDAQNYFQEEAPLVKIPLDKDLTPAQNAQRYYNQYRRKKTAEEHLIEQLEKAAAETDYLESVLDSLSRAQNIRDLGEIKQELSLQGYIVSKGKTAENKSKKNTKQSFSLLEFVSSSGDRIVCGKNNFQNDYLTFELAKKNDIWLHVKSLHGAHVAVILKEDKISDKTLFEAATIAATYSKGRNSGKVEVDYTQIKYVKRSPFKKPGMVFYTQQKTIVVSPDENLCKKLLVSNQR